MVAPRTKQEEPKSRTEDFVETGYPLEQGYVLDVNFVPVFCKSTAQLA
jgi:hypothetical protein